MCLVVLAFDAHPDHALIVAGNRDEFHKRPTQAASWWPDKPDIAGGRDLLAGGTWLAIHRNGRFATVTNTRDAEPKRGKLRSRGHLVTGFLQSNLTPLAYLQSVNGNAYAGFNLLVADKAELAYFSNQGDEPRALSSGVYGLSNARLDSPCDKVQRSKERLSRLLVEGRANQTELLRLLADRGKGPASEVTSDRLPFATAHATTAPFIVLPDFGTRCSTIVSVNRQGRCHFLERRFDPDGRSTGESVVNC